MITTILENLLESWCNKKNIEFERLPTRIIDLVVGRTEDDIMDFLKDNEQVKSALEEWAWMEIEQNLDEHPEWKVATKSKEGGK